MRVSSMTFVLATICSVAGSTACATHVAGRQLVSPAEAQDASGQLRAGSRSETLTADELMKADVQTTAEAVRRLRPEFLRTTQVVGVDGPSRAYPTVYLNGTYAGRVEALELIALGAVEEIRFFRPAQAKEQWGSYCQCAGGVISVRTRPTR